MYSWIFLLSFTYWSAGAPTIRRDSLDIPSAPVSNGNCRVRLNEINVYPPGAQQFVELIRICKDTPQKVFDVSLEDSKKQSVYKLVFISHDGHLLGVCNLRGKMKSRQGPYVFYTIGGEYYKDGITRDMRIEDCFFASDYEYAPSRNRFPIGNNAPVGLALVYNQSPTVLNALSLDQAGTIYKRVKIDSALKKKILQNLQDFVVYTSSSPYTHCKYFSEYYANYVPSSEGLYFLRDWALIDEDYSRSRCQEVGVSEAWLPFHPKNYKYAPSSPNAPNICEKSVHFVIEEQQTRRPTERKDFGEIFTCLVTTEDDAIEALNTITNPITYGTKLQTIFGENKMRLTQAMQEMLPPQNVPECEHSCAPALPIDDDNVPQVQPPLAFSVHTIPQDVFERQLEELHPHIWPTCNNLESSEIITWLKSQRNPDIYPEDILRTEVCSWFEYIVPARKFRCKFCNRLLTQGIIAETKGSKLLSPIMTTGQGYSGQPWSKTANSKFIKEHASNPIHQVALDYFIQFDSGKRGEDLQKSFDRKGGPLEKHMEATENAFRNVFQCVRLDITFEKYEVSVETLTYYEVNVGFLYHNPQGYKAILMSISATMHEELVARLLMTKPVLSVMIDTSTDVSSMATLAIVFHIFGEDGGVEVVLYRIIKVVTAETGEALYDLFKSALKEDGLEDYVKARTIGFSSDGGSNVKKFRTLLNGFTDHKLALIHCMNHRLELAIKNAWKSIPEMAQIEELVNTVYGLFHRSAKKKIILSEASVQEGDKDFTLKRLIKTRWMASRARAINSIFEHWKPIVTALLEIEKDKSFKVDQRIKAATAYQMLMDPLILSTLAFTADACEAIAAVSLQLQQRATSVIGKKEKREMLMDTLIRLQSENGPRLESLLEASKLKNPSTTTETTLDQLENFPVTYKEVDLITTGDIYFGKLTSKRSEYLTAVVDQIDNYYPDDVTDKFDILDPTRWAEAALTDFGNNDLKELNSALLWNYNAETLLASWKKLKASVYKHEEFQIRRKGNPDDFWQYYLVQTSIEWNEDIKTIVQSILTVQSSTAEVERIYSMYTHTKTPQRFCLDVTTVEATVRVKFNGPKRLKDFRARDYAMKFLREHSRADDDGRRRTWTRKNKENGGEEASAAKQARQEDPAGTSSEDIMDVDDLCFMEEGDQMDEVVEHNYF